jgi:hypothetical protein
LNKKIGDSLEITKGCVKRSDKISGTMILNSGTMKPKAANSEKEMIL